MADTFTSLFLAALTLSVVARIWLARRHVAHVLANRDRVPAEFSERITLAAHQKAADYTVTKSRFGLIGLTVEIALLLGLTLGGGLDALAGFWHTRLDGIGYGLALIFSVALLSGVIDLPLALWRQFVIEARFGFNRMTPGLFFLDLLKSTLLGAAIGTPVILAVLWLMGSMGTLWWLYVWLFWCSFNLLILFAYPTWIAPLFNKFTPMEAGETKTRVEALLERCGFRSGGLFVMDGSKRSAHGNAYFTGFGRNKRIVFFDTLLKRLQPEEIEAVLAHELGHFSHHHVFKRIVMMFAVSLAFLALLGQLIEAPWFYAGLGVDSANQGTAMALILFFVALPAFTFPLTPLGSMLSRRHEFEADQYAAANASSADLVRALVKLYEDNASTLTPDPVHSLFYDSHPPAAIRISRLQAANT
jgi:STE24 endopeptidase